MIKKMRRALLVLGGAGVLMASVPGAIVRTDAKPKSSAKSASSKIAWRNSFTAAQAEAKRTGKPIMVDFYATWCGPCKMLDASTWKSPQVAKASQGFVPVKVDVDKNKALAAKYKINGIPAIMFMLPNGQVVHSVVGYMEADRAMKMMKTAAARAKAKSEPPVLSAMLPR